MSQLERRERGRERFRAKVDLKYLIKEQFTETLRHLNINRNRYRIYEKICDLYIDHNEIMVEGADSRIWCADPYFEHAGIGEKKRIPEIYYDTVFTSFNAYGFSSVWCRMVFIEYLMVRRIVGYFKYLVSSKPLRRLRAKKKIILWNRGKFADHKILGNILYYLTC